MPLSQEVFEWQICPQIWRAMGWWIWESLKTCTVRRKVIRWVQSFGGWSGNAGSWSERHREAGAGAAESSNRKDFMASETRKRHNDGEKKVRLISFLISLKMSIECVFDLKISILVFTHSHCKQLLDIEEPDPSTQTLSQGSPILNPFRRISHAFNCFRQL